MNYTLFWKWKTWQKLLLTCALLAVCSYSSSKTPSEYDVKLVYLYNFTRFINWPDSAFNSPEAPYSICVMGDIPSRESAKMLEQKRSRNRPIAIHFLDSDKATDTCHILFITKSIEFAAMSNITKRTSPYTLTIGESPGFAKHNGEIGFLLDNRNHVRVEINLHGAKQKEIDMRAKLLEIARKVYREGED